MRDYVKNTVQTFLDLIPENHNKRGLLIVIDGVGGISHKDFDYKTELEYADIKNFDHFAAISDTGLIDPVGIGITPGSSTGHQGLFGYEPFHQWSRGALSAAGIGLDLKYWDVYARFNFANVKDGIITDRRGAHNGFTRVQTQENEKLVKMINEKITHIDDVQVKAHTVKEHRFVVTFKGENLYGNLTDSDPGKTGSPPLVIKPKDEKSKKMAYIANKYIEEVNKLLKNRDWANYVLSRGWGMYDHPTPFSKRYKFKKPACIATYPDYKGIANYLGIKVLNCEDSIESEFETLKKYAFDLTSFTYISKKPIPMEN